MRQEHTIGSLALSLAKRVNYRFIESLSQTDDDDDDKDDERNEEETPTPTSGFHMHLHTFRHPPSPVTNSSFTGTHRNSPDLELLALFLHLCSLNYKS